MSDVTDLLSLSSSSRNAYIVHVVGVLSEYNFVGLLDIIGSW